MRNSTVKRSVIEIIKGLFDNNQLWKDRLTKDPKQFENDLKRIDSKKIMDSILDDLIVKTTQQLMEKEVNFYNKWQDRLAVDAIQGLEDENEVLGGGVCLAKCLRVGSFEIAHPDLPIDQIGAGEITPADRFDQARYSKALKDLQNDDVIQLAGQLLSIPEEVYRKHGYSHVKFVAYAKSSPTSSFVKEISEFISDLPLNPEMIDMLKQSNGVLHLGIFGKGSRVMLSICRMDLERETFRFHDPNIGYFEIIFALLLKLSQKLVI